MFAAIRRFRGLFAVAALGIAVSFVAVDMAEARRGGGSFGSRGTRTFSAPPATSTAPGQAAPINRSMTPNTNPATPNAARPSAQAPQQSRGLFGGMMGGLMGGLLMGGLFGMLMGGGFGGMAGFFGMLIQGLLIGGLIMLAMRFFASRRQGQPAFGGASGSNSARNDYSAPQNNQASQGGFKIPQMGSKAGSFGGAGVADVAAAPAAPKAVPHANAMSEGDEIGVTQVDLETFQKTLQGVQAAYAAEDYGTLRKLTTPEAMSYLAEELSDNATSGVKNDVRDVTLLQGDVSEAWHEEGRDYATVAMRYSAIDIMRDRTTGKIVQGDEHKPEETIELWTFVRANGTEWQVSAIQAAA